MGNKGSNHTTTSRNGSVRPQRRRAGVWITGLIVVVILVVATLLLTNKQDVSPEVGHVAPNFTLTSLQGQTVSLAQFRGKPVFLNFFASWCPPCQFETPDVEKMYKQYGSKIVFLGVNLTSNDTVPRVKSFIKQFGVTYPVLLDSKGTVASAYKVMAIPTSLFITPNGVVQNRYLGAMVPGQMQRFFKQLATSQ